MFGLGDSPYENFAKTGKDFDSRLAALEAQRLHDRVDADVDCQSQAEALCAALVERLKARMAIARPTQQQLAISGNVNKVDSSPYTEDAPLSAHLSVTQKITSRQSQKNVWYLDLADFGLRYQPGDALQKH